MHRLLFSARLGFVDEWKRLDGKDWKRLRLVIAIKR
jgi:hypothetical protein